MSSSIMASSSTRDTLRTLLAQEGVERVYTLLLQEMREQYRFLHTLFSQQPDLFEPAAAVPQPAVPQPEATPSPSVPQHPAPSPPPPVMPPVPQPATQPTPPPATPKKVVKRVGRPPKVIPPPYTPAGTVVAHDEAEPEPQPEPLPAVEPVAVPAAAPAAPRAGQMTKTEHNALVAARAVELRNQGIDGASLLTKENLTQWIQNQKWTYMKVARETGVPDAQVSALAKSYGLMSQNAAMIRMKKGWAPA